MKAILYIVAILAACGAAFFSFNHSNKFKALEERRARSPSTTNKKTTANADVQGHGTSRRKKPVLAASKEKKRASRRKAFPPSSPPAAP